MPQNNPEPIYLADYTPPDYLVDTVELRFDLSEERALVDASLRLRRNPEAGAHTRPLVLDGEALRLEHLALDGEALPGSRYALTETSLTLPEVPDRFRLDLRTRLFPHLNTALEGLYKSAGTFCTQCEAEGFRRITYYPDRPDVLARFTTTLSAEEARYPVLLSNGNPTASGRSEGRHWVTWEDPYPKPAYLFALVAGNLRSLEDRFVTRGGREVALRIFVEPHNIDKCEHAMASLKKAMKWDEEVYGLEYDLDIFMIVAVDDFNMGAMENKGLNIFNSKYVLADPETATDDDYAAIEGVIAHEYFHNWTGNRVTLRDWFQLSLKEGLTVFRDQQFSGDMGSRAVNRIRDVRALRSAQFPEDSGPMAHPVRPPSYIEINNFYTATVYNKGAEVIRMIHTLLGAERFRAGLDLYFERHDGQAVTTEDFVHAMQDASGVDLGSFGRWYEQAGTPTLEVRGAWDESAGSYSLDVAQRCPPTPGQEHKAPLHIPLALGLLSESGRALPVRLAGEGQEGASETRVLSVTEARQRFTFAGVHERPVPSLLRDFSAPVRLELEGGAAAYPLLSAFDPDPFNRWEAGQQFATAELFELIHRHRAGRALELSEGFVDALRHTLLDADLDRALVAEALLPPAETYLAELMDTVDVDAIHTARQCMRRAVAEALREELTAAYLANAANEPYRFEPRAAARRRLRNVCLGYLMENGDSDAETACLRQFHEADNMTDVLAALRLFAATECDERTEVLAAFERRWAEDPLVLDKWFSAQATSPLPDALTAVERLTRHRAFNIKNPNRVRAVVGAFCFGNQVRFHAPGGEGYRFLTERVMEIDPLNPQLSARLLGAFARWRKFDAPRAALMRAELQRVLERPGLSRDAFEVASKSLA